MASTQLHLYRPSSPPPSWWVRKHSSPFSIPPPFSLSIRSTQQGAFFSLCKQFETRSAASSSSFENGRAEHQSDQEPNETITEKAWKHIQKANTFLPQVVMASTVLALLFPPSFTWFTNRFAASLSRNMRPLMPLLSVLVTSLCVGSPLAMNTEAVRSPFGLAVLLLVIGFHSAAFLLGFYFSKPLFWRAPDVMKIQKTLSFETGMQSSLLGLALANKFFADPLVGLPSAISTVLMSLMGFALVLYWNMEKERASHA